MSEPSASREEVEKAFLATPDAGGLVHLYRFLRAEGRDDLLASILNRVRPIQHRITLIQADAEPALLEALCRDPHAHVRQVVASHANISEEVCFRLGEDQQAPVRLALRKNPNCHPVIRAALTLQERGDEDSHVRADALLEIAWQARRAEFDAKRTVALIQEWVGLGPDDLSDLSLEQANKVLEVLAGHLGQGPMPRKPSKSGKGSKKSRRSKKR